MYGENNMKITKKTRNLLLGMSIGDGHLTGGRLCITHCDAQYEYLVWKQQLLRKNGIKTREIMKFNNSGYVGYKLKTERYDFIKSIEHYLYCPQKTITRKILNRLTPLEIAIWYMDDGGLSQKRRNGIVVANDLMLNTGLQKEENQIIINYFSEVWGIRFTQVKNHNCYRLRCGTKEARKFISIVYPYVSHLKCFSHKMNVKQ